MVETVFVATMQKRSRGAAAAECRAKKTRRVAAQRYKIDVTKC